MKFDRVFIDYFSGSHGNFLEYLCNRYLFDIESARFNPFEKNGTSHVKTPAYLEDRLAEANHYSYHNLPMQSTPQSAVVRIVIDLFYPVVYNSIIRGGATSLDIEQLEFNTLDKLTEDKNKPYRIDIVEQFGIQQNYPRDRLRNLFYAKFNEPQFGIEPASVQRDFALPTFEIPLTAFYDYIKLNSYLGELSKFAGKIGWSYNTDLYPLWSEFMSKNIGYQSYVKCQNIIEKILTNQDYTIECNLLEEAYINSYITSTFNIHSDIVCFNGLYPNNTQDIYNLIINQVRKQRDIQPH